MKTQNETSALEERLSRLENELYDLRKERSTPTRDRTVDSSEDNFVIRAHFGRVALERKPFIVTLESSERISRTLTPVRAAILLVLLMDLLERSEAGKASIDNLARTKDALSELAPEEASNSSHDAVRVALYRAGQFIKEEFSGTIDDELSFAVRKGELIVLHRGVAVSPHRLEVEITTSDQTISAFLDRSLATSPLSRLRKAKTLYVPPGPDGQDRLLMELLDHDFPVREVCLFYRPTIQSFPQELLAKLGTPKSRRIRQEIAMQGYQSGRIRYTEILPRKCLWDLIRRVPGKGFALYPQEVTATDVISHLDHLQFLVRSIPSYELVITDAFFPFYLNTFEITRSETTERFVLFFQHAEEDNVRHVSVFALKDDAVFFSTQDRIISWILSHPTTIRNREHILSEIDAVRTSLLESIENPQTEFSARDTRLNKQSAPTHDLPLTAQCEIHSAQKEAQAFSDKQETTANENLTNRRES